MTVTETIKQTTTRFSTYKKIIIIFTVLRALLSRVLVAVVDNVLKRELLRACTIL